MAISGDTNRRWNTARFADGVLTGQVIKAAPGQVGGWVLSNASGNLVVVRLYDKATAPTTGDTPKVTIVAEAQVTQEVLAVAGIDFTSGISIRVTANLPDNDNAAVPGGSGFWQIFWL